MQRGALMYGELARDVLTSTTAQHWRKQSQARWFEDTFRRLLSAKQAPGKQCAHIAPAIDD